MMTPHTLTVLSAPLAAIDRRALSQAWYSALHLAAHRPNAEAKMPTAAATMQPATAKHESTRCARFPRDVEHRLDVHRAIRPRDRIASDTERRMARSPLARKIEHAFLHPLARVTRATFTVEGTNARVHVTVQRGSTGMRIVAVCPQRVRPQVERALAEARFALASRGVALNVSLSDEATR